MITSIVLLIISFGLSVLGVIGKTRQEEKKTVGQPTRVGWIVIGCLAVSLAISSMMVISDNATAKDKEKQLKIAQSLTTILAANNVKFLPNPSVRIKLASQLTQKIKRIASESDTTRADSQRRMIETALFPPWLHGQQFELNYSLWAVDDPFRPHPYFEGYVDGATNFYTVVRNGSSVRTNWSFDVIPDPEGLVVYPRYPLITNAVLAEELIHIYSFQGKELFNFKTYGVHGDDKKVIAWFRENVKKIQIECAPDESGLFTAIVPLTVEVTQAKGLFIGQAHVDNVHTPYLLIRTNLQDAIRLTKE